MNSGITFFRYLDELSEFTGIHKSELFHGCYDIYNSLNISATDLLQIAINLNVDPTLLWTRKIDFKNLKSMRDGEFSLPAAYSEIRASNIASIKNTLEQFRKYDLYDYALKKIQIDERVLKANTNISILAGTDLFDFAKDFFTEKEYSDIANRNATVAFDNFLKKEISTSQSGIKIAKEIINLASNVEQNWDYRFIHSDLKSIIIETNESDLMRSGRSYRSYTNDITTFIRFTFIKSALKHFNVKNVQINPISDWNNHDKKFRFSINIQ